MHSLPLRVWTTDVVRAEVGGRVQGRPLQPVHVVGVDAAPPQQRTRDVLEGGGVTPSRRIDEDGGTLVIPVHSRRGNGG